MKSKNPYLFLSKTCIRTPIFPLTNYTGLVENKTLDFGFFKQFWDHPVFKEALFIASSTLYDRYEEWMCQKSNLSNKDIDKLKFSILKYIARSTSRCTPFGLFAGCSLASFDKETNLQLAPYPQYRRQTRLDMNFLVAMSQKLSENEHLQKQLRWYPNSSLYQIGSQYRYIEYLYNKQGNREHAIEAIHVSEYLAAIINAAKNGLKLDDLVEILQKDPDVSKEEADGFIEQLIENQVLVSELEPALTGTDVLEVIVETLKRIALTPEISRLIEDYVYELSKIDQTIGNSTMAYTPLLDRESSLNLNTELKYRLQTDLFPQLEQNTISTTWGYKTVKLLSFFAKITQTPEETNLEAFKTAFLKRYETHEVSLTTILDTEVGIGYLQHQESSDTTPFLDDLSIPARHVKNEKYIKNSFQQILAEKLSISSGNYQITLTADDVSPFNANYSDLPDTMSAMGSLFSIEGEECMFLSSIGSSSAANLLGRFTTGDQDISRHVQQIVDIEERNHKDKVLAEIIHLPQSRTGNILRRDIKRKFEIPYLAKSSLSSDQQITVDDLMVSVKNGSIFLRSKRLNKEVVPRLSNAHNYSYNALPVYQFLCDLQHQNKRSSVGFSWGSYLEEKTFLPRVFYQDFIISKARWKFKVEEIKPIFSQVYENRNAFDQWKKQWQLPRYFSLVDGDNTLLIDSNNITCLQMLWDTIKNRNSCHLEEFLSLPQNCVVHNTANEPFVNQVIISIYKLADHDTKS